MSTFLFYALRGDSNFLICEWNPMVWPFKWKLLRVWAVLFCGTVYFSVQGGYNTWVLTKSWRAPPSYKANEQFFLVGLFIETVQACPDVDELILKCSAISHIKLIEQYKLPVVLFDLLNDM